MKKLLLYLFLAFLFVNIVDPTNTIFKIKYLLFAVFIFLATIYISKNNKKLRLNKDIFLITGLFFVLVTYSIFIGAINGFNDLSLAIPFAYLILIFFVTFLSFNTCIYKKFLLIVLVVAFLNILTLIVVMYFSEYFTELYSFFAKHSHVIMFAKRELFGIETYMIYHKSSTLLIFPLLYFCYLYFSNKKILYLIVSCIILFGIILSGTRANIIISLLAVTFLTFHFLLLKKRYIKVTLIIFVIFIFIFYANEYILIAFDKSDMSNSIKLMHINSILNSIIDSSIMSILFGQGIGSLYYSDALNGLTILTEVTYFEMFRIFGLLGIVLFTFLLIFIPLYFFIKDDSLRKMPYLYYAYFSYLIIASSNPLLFSTTGMIVVVIVYIEIFKFRNYNIDLERLKATENKCNIVFT